jgi:hypothetical protein
MVGGNLRWSICRQEKGKPMGRGNSLEKEMKAKRTFLKVGT